jgi:hypothetical protein
MANYVARHHNRAIQGQDFQGYELCTSKGLKGSRSKSVKCWCFLKYIQKRKQEEFKNSLFINMVNIKYSSKVQTQNKNIENMNFIPCQHFEKFCRILISPIYTSVYLYTGMSCCNVRWKMASHLQQCSSIPVQFNTFDFVVSNFHHK